ncbi:MAG: GNAT family N-acetyltransferase [Flavobacteriales bacterium]|nr:GNAT family N-acetyltransferase [Flavobacteriales bacterium]
MTSAKKKYQLLCKINKEIPLFLTYDWYQSLFSDKEWNVVIVERGEEVVGFLPYNISKKKSFTLISNPMLTPYQGIWLNYPQDQKYVNKLGFEKEIITELIKQLPKVDSFQQKFIPEFTNWLPFYWEGYSQTTRYTYVIDNLSDEDKIFDEFKENIRREIRKAEKKLKVENSKDIKQLYEMKQKIYQKNGEEYPISFEFLKKVNDFVHQNKCGELLVAVDEKNNIHSMLLYVWDNNSAYYLHGVTDKRYKTTGSMSLLLWEAIKRSSNKTKAFNFEGSMIESIERYFRAFGGQQTPYFEIKKTSSKLLKLLNY